MPCTRCRQKVQATLPPGVRVKSLKNEPDEDLGPAARFFVEFLGKSLGVVTYKGPSGTVYRFAAGDTAEEVPECDADFFVRLPIFRVVPA